MPATEIFEFILLILLVILTLEVAAHKLHLPPAVALIAGGTALAFIPNLRFEVPPDLMLVLFLPPLLIEGAYFTSWRDFRSNLGGILSLAVGAVLFTTIVVGFAVHWITPALPWAACFALGAVVSPPDAVAARAVLERVKLPRRLLVELQGESLLNDAAGLTLLRFAVVAAITHHFSLGAAAGTFVLLSVGGVGIGLAIGFLAVRVLPRLGDTSLMVLGSFLLSWAAYIAGEEAHVSGVLAAVAGGMVLGWYQHEVFSASLRVKANSFWRVSIFVMEAFVFMQIGLTLRHITTRIGSLHEVWTLYGLSAGVTVAAVILARFAWVYLAGLARSGLSLALKREAAPFSWRSAFVVSWAGMRGVVTIAVAVALPEDMPGRSLIVVAAFIVVLVTVVLQGTSLGWIIRLLNPQEEKSEHGHLTRPQAVARITKAQLGAIEKLAYDAQGRLVHPRLLEQYTYRVKTSQNYSEAQETLAGARQAHYETLLAAIEAGRKELLTLHRGGHLEDELMHNIEQQLDLQELAADLERSAP